MKDITNIDWKDDYTMIKESDVAKMPKQKVFFLQNGLEYDAAGMACNAAQVKKYYSQVAIAAQKTADEAKESAAAAQVSADAMLKNASMNKTEARKAG